MYFFILLLRLPRIDFGVPPESIIVPSQELVLQMSDLFVGVSDINPRNVLNCVAVVTSDSSNLSNGSLVTFKPQISGSRNNRSSRTTTDELEVFRSDAPC